MDLLARWNDLTTRLGFSYPECGEALIAAYGEPHRHYHTTQHLAECFDLLDRFEDPSRLRDLAELALWFHDAVYDPRAPHGVNEQQSAASANKWLSPVVAPNQLARVTYAVLATTGHHVSADAVSDVVCDIDLAILAATPERFAEYERQIREEYAWVPPEQYRQARRRVLQGFLDRSWIYTITRSLERGARRNLEAAIRALD